MDESVIKMTTDCIKLLHSKILTLIAADALKEFRHQSAEDLAETLLKLKALASTATARVLPKIHVNEKTEVERVVKLRQAENAKSNANIKKKEALLAKQWTNVVNQACKDISTLLTAITCSYNNSTGQKRAIDNGKAVMVTISQHLLTSAEITHRIPMSLTAYMSPYLKSVHATAPSAKLPTAPDAGVLEEESKEAPKKDLEMKGLFSYSDKKMSISSNSNFSSENT